MRKAMLISVATIFGLAGCAGLVLGQLLNQLSVTLDSAIPFPDNLTLQLAPQPGQALAVGDALLGRLGGSSVEQRLGEELKAQTQVLRQQGAAMIRQQVQDSKIFGSVVERGGNLGLSVGVSRFGLAYNAASGGYQLVLDLEMKLSSPDLGVIWSGQRSAANLTGDVQRLASRVDLSSLLAQSNSFNSVAKAAVRDLSGQLLDDLKQHPPIYAINSHAGHTVQNFLSEPTPVANAGKQ
jgi:hypothetical protein